ncbi:hypothetical protein [Bradyrhizobium sp. S3.7.6]
MTTAIEFLKAWFAHTTGPIYTCSFTNERGAGPERHVLSRKPAEITGFVERWDQNGRGTFVCVSTIKQGAQKRNKENVEQFPALFIDIDFKNTDLLGDEPIEDVMKQLRRAKFLPSATILSGGGVHAYWFLKEPFDLDSDDAKARIEAALRQLADIFAGDLQVCEVARVMRMPQSRNSKTGEPIPVMIASFDPDRRYELDDLEEWFSEQSPLLLRKAREPGQTVGEMQVADDDFFAQYAKEHGIKPPIDVIARLEGMMYMGPGDSSIHQTQIQCAASMLSTGMELEDVVNVIMHYTRLAAGGYGARWNWRIEERNLRKDCESWLKKHPRDEKKKVEPKFTVIEGELQRNVTTRNEVEREDKEGREAVDGNVVKMPVITPAPPKPNELHIAIGKAVIAKFAADGEQMIRTKEGAWLYSNGVWELRTEYDWLDVRVEKISVGFGYKTSMKLINETRNWIKRQPELWRDNELPWDQHGKIPTRSGLVDPLTGTLEPARPDHFCTWRVEVDYDPSATCPWWQTMISDMFGDKDDGEQADLVRVVQECMGAALIDSKPRSMSKALVFWGIQNLGKSGPLDVVAGMFGRVIAAPIGTVESTHGAMPFRQRQPWVLHEAFGGQWHFSQTVKSIITQEPVGINVKNGPLVTQIVRAPIFWATNFQPQFKEATKAIVSRMIIIEVSRQFFDDKPVGAAAEAIRRGFAKPGEFVAATELPGVLNWAIAGLRRALERGSIELTASIKETSEAIHRDSNLVAGFLEDCIEFDPMARIRVSDFCLAHSAWWMELKGEDRRLPTNEAIGKAMKSIGDPRIGADLKEMRDNTSRYYCGIALNKSGLRYHRTAFESRLFEGKIATATDPAREVNSIIPPSWDTRKSVVAMRARHGDKGEAQ